MHADHEEVLTLSQSRYRHKSTLRLQWRGVAEGIQDGKQEGDRYKRASQNERGDGKGDRKRSEICTKDPVPDLFLMISYTSTRLPSTLLSCKKSMQAFILCSSKHIFTLSLSMNSNNFPTQSQNNVYN